jgi:hypothetical protein
MRRLVSKMDVGGWRRSTGSASERFHSTRGWRRPVAGDGKAKYSREQFVRTVADQEYAPVDSELSDWYYEISRLGGQAAALGPIGPAPLLGAQLIEPLGDEFPQRPRRVRAVGSPHEAMSRDPDRRPLGSPRPMVSAAGGNGGDHPTVPFHAPCVCGRDATFGDCCAPRGRPSRILPDQNDSSLAHGPASLRGRYVSQPQRWPRPRV